MEQFTEKEKHKNLELKKNWNLLISVHYPYFFPLDSFFILLKVK